MSTPTEVWSYRTLILNLAQRDLKARYKRSLLGWLWSLINPAATLGVYTLVFGVILRAEPPGLGNGEEGNFALYLFCGLIVWNAFSGVINSSIGSFASAGPILTRTYFPPECPMVAGLVTVLLQSAIEAGILLFVMIILGNISWTGFVLLPVMVLLSAFAFGLGLVLAVMNIRYRDVAYLMGILLQVWFYATPIVYPEDIVPDHVHRFLQLNPLNAYVNAARRAMYHLELPTLTNWAIMGGTAVVSLAVGWYLFSRLAPRVIEEL